VNEKTLWLVDTEVCMNVRARVDGTFKALGTNSLRNL